MYNKKWYTNPTDYYNISFLGSTQFSISSFRTLIIEQTLHPEKLLLKMRRIF